VSDFQTSDYKKVQLLLDASTIQTRCLQKKRFFGYKMSSKQRFLSWIVRHYASGVFRRTTQ